METAVLLAETWTVRPRSIPRSLAGCVNSDHKEWNFLPEVQICRHRYPLIQIEFPDGNFP